MSTAELTITPPQLRNVADLLQSLGDISPERIRLRPPPGEATVDDLIENNDVRKDFRCELIDGVLVEKAHMSFLENRLTAVIAYFLHVYLQANRLGVGFTEGAMFEMSGGNFRLPDFTVCLRDKFPSGKVEHVPYADFAPDFAIEVLSRSNTRREIERKRGELFASGTHLIWVVDPAERTVEVYTPAGRQALLTEADCVTGGDVLPGFELSIREWFRQAEEV